MLTKIHNNILLLNILIIEGKINTISTSKIKKIIVIKKNWREKGTREDDFWSKPHSKADNFSRSKKDFFERKTESSITKFETKAIIKIVHIMFIINYFN